MSADDGLHEANNPHELKRSESLVRRILKSLSAYRAETWRARTQGRRWERYSSSSFQRGRDLAISTSSMGWIDSRSDSSPSYTGPTRFTPRAPAREILGSTECVGDLDHEARIPSGADEVDSDEVRVGEVGASRFHQQNQEISSVIVDLYVQQRIPELGRPERDWMPTDPRSVRS